VRPTAARALEISLSCTLSMTACSSGDGPGTSALAWTDCTLEGGIEAECATLAVPEDRDAPASQTRTLTLRVARLAAKGGAGTRDAFTILAGGPGQAATEVGPMLSTVVRAVREHHDVLLVDQRGTGGSHPLDCEREDPDRVATWFEAELDPAELQRCLRGWDADLRHYHSAIAAADLDAVREAAGYEALHLFGISYGTRMALVYAQHYPQRVRSMVLDAVAPPTMKLPLWMGVDGERALERLAARCESDAECHAAFPDVLGDVKTLLARLEASPEEVVIAHPRTWRPERVAFSRTAVAASIFGALYSGETAALVPYAVSRALAHDYTPLVGMAAARMGAADTMSTGMFAAVICAEDLPRITAAERLEASSWLLGDAMVDEFARTCALVPNGAPPPTYGQIPAVEAPTLVLSGEDDPVTPPRWGDATAAALPKARHVVVPGMGHGAWAHARVAQELAEFVAEGDLDGFDATAFAGHQPPPIFVTASGPGAPPGAPPDARVPPAAREPLEGAAP
jgi:pimeloyl-ACP methyl ester carboxylesterase